MSKYAVDHPQPLLFRIFQNRLVQKATEVAAVLSGRCLPEEKAAKAAAKAAIALNLARTGTMFGAETFDLRNGG
jgi:hypothetical protein